MRKALIIALVIVSMIGIAAAWATLGISPKIQDIDIGTYGYYVLTLESNNNMNSLNWKTTDSTIVASIDGGTGYGADSQNSATTLVPSYVGGSGPKSYNMRVMPKTGAIIGNEYDITVDGIDAHGVAKATVTGTTVPTPEMATGTLLSVGLIGLIGLVRYRKK